MPSKNTAIFMSLRKFIMKLKLLTSIFSILFLLTIGVFAQKTTEYIVVNEKMVDCTTVGKTKCLQIKKPQETQWENFSGEIENFRFESGYFYLLEVKKTNVKNPPADGSSFKYRLKKIINREKSSTETAGKTLAGTKWILDEIEGEKVNTDRAFLTFNIKENRFGGNGGCNGMGGTLKVENSTIKMSQIISTKMFCQNTSEIENSFLAKLQDTNRYEIKGEILYFYKGETLLLELKAE